MRRVEIGRVIEITNSDIVVEVLKKYESSHIMIESCPVRLSGVGNFIKVGTLIYQIDVEKVSDMNNKLENGKVLIDKKLHCSLVGYIEDNQFKEGTNGETPDLFQKAYKISDGEERLIYDNGDESNSINLGNYVLNREIKFYIDINKMIASHILIVGNTGSGKSNTLAVIYEKLFSEREEYIIQSDSKFLIIDSNGEYSNAFSKNSKLINRKVLNVKSHSNTLKIPIRSLDENDWRILLDATDKTQFPVIRKVISGVQKYIFDVSNNTERISNFLGRKIRDSIIAILDSKETPSVKMSGLLRVNEFIRDYANNTIDGSEASFSVEGLIEEIEINNNRLKWKHSSLYNDDLKEIRDRTMQIDFISGSIKSFSVSEFELLLNLEYLYRVYRFSISDNNISPMLSRFASNKAVYSKIFDPYDITGYNFKDLEYLLFNKKPVALCDFSLAGKDISRSVVSLLASKLFDKAVERRTENNKYSYHIIIDEAHNYLSRISIAKEDAIAESCIEIFEKIIKEGRKFNTFITMATQRPSEITATLLSQAHNYVIHKLVNPNDILIVTNTVPFLDSMSAKMIPILSPGQAIFSGTAFSKPNIVKVNMPELKVNSDTIKLSDLWSSKQKKN